MARSIVYSSEYDICQRRITGLPVILQLEFQYNKTLIRAVLLTAPILYNVLYQSQWFMQMEMSAPYAAGLLPIIQLKIDSLL